MAELSASTTSAGGKVRTRKRSTKIDMTPMVDLAFLLLTFFILTTTFNKPQIMQVDVPDKPKTTDPIAKLEDRNAFNLVLNEEGKINWWIGLDGPVNATDYRKVRNVILSELKRNGDLMFLIKPADKSKFENIVDILDEMAITKAPRFAIVDITDEDRMKIEKAR